MIAILNVTSVPRADAVSQAAVHRETAPAEWSLLTGYGETHVGLGDTSQRVRSWDVIVRRRIIRKHTGRNGYRGSHDFLAEAAVSHLLEPSGRQPVYALNFLACWTLKRWDHSHPRIFVGGGPVYTEAKIDGMGSRINGNYQAGAGISFFPNHRFSSGLEYRFHHISNGGLDAVNDSLNSSKILGVLRIGW